ncbi:alpha/beta hydrolase [Blastococcus brunescens]|uniref:Alpha/beta hydrolase n=1 Tax=Blastococcus brunescens TaxID=1564165 RepID=A0ABZ1B437_9ACTN|nr:alpha/beta hydrolase [Blastococcus sp. BMG 8361]WRL64926.1 alpha/beta hydrolase [Blastococcus sp. BMG 8361]
MADVLLPGIASTRVPTPGSSSRCCTPTASTRPGRGGRAVRARQRELGPLLAAGAARRRADRAAPPLAVDLRGYGDTDPLPVDATRGVRDWADDLAALIATLQLDRVHLVGWSMGAGVVLQYLLDAPERVASVALVAPISPYGFGGTAGTDGARVHADGTGSGAGAANPEFVAALTAGDTTADAPTSPRSILRAFYVAPGSLPLDPASEDVFVASMLSTRTGVDHYPGKPAGSDAWPGVAPGARGVLNTMAPTVFDVSGIVDLPAKPPVLWVRGDLDQIVSDASAFDLAFLGSVGAVPGWPGAEAFPPQPMVAQTRAVLDRYAATGGAYREVVLPDVGHSPHVERPQQFAVALLEHLDVPAEVPANLR